MGRLLMCVVIVSAIVQISCTEPAKHWKDLADQDLRRALNFKTNNGVAKNMILYLGDGNGISTITATRIYKGQMQENNAGGEEYVLYYEKFPQVGLAKTYCVDRQVPDSASTGTAYLCGTKSKYETIGMDPRVELAVCPDEDLAVDSIMKLAQDAGKVTGIVTTTRVTHATPANTYAHAADRRWEGIDGLPDEQAAKGCTDIAYQLVNSDPGKNFRVILGGGRRKFLTNETVDFEEAEKKGERTDGINLIDRWLETKPEGSNSHFVWNDMQFKDIDAKNTDYLLGLFEYDHMQYEADRTNEPSLAEMTEKAIEILSQHEQGYVLLVEGGRMDHGHHYGKAYHAMVDGVAFEEAVKKGGELTREKDTLSIVTADHSFSFDMIGYPSRGNPILGLNDLQKSENGLPFTTLQYVDGPGSKEVIDAIIQHGIPPNLTKTDTADEDYLQQAHVPNKYAGHDGEDVIIYAKGPMAHLFHSTHEQTYIYYAMRYAACIGDVPDDCMTSRGTVATYQNDVTCGTQSNLPGLWVITVLSIVSLVTMFFK
ncbi:alkaline phosphatase, tissue-nonspecific isozyme-like [Glandiceps talaboti]